MAVRADALDERCETCGFEWAQLSPPDAAVAARSLGRRWLELLDKALGDDDGVDLVRRHQPGGWSVVGHGAHVAEVLERKAVALAAVRDHHRPVLPAADIEAPHASDDTADPTDVAGDITGAAEMLARTIESISGDDWLRVGTLGGRDVTASHLARDAVHEAAHHLRAAADVLADANPRDGHREE